MKIVISLAAVLILGFTACTKSGELVPAGPLASFETSVFENGINQADELEVIELTNTSENGIAYHWDFGNGTTSAEQHPTVMYKMHGNYTVKLTVTHDDGKTTEATKEIIVLCTFSNRLHVAPL
jgi:chitodextrinase